METKTITKRLRFEVFKRDKFSCQYCGESAPDVILHIDHINPKSKGGENHITNLITACSSCNLGKSDRKLSDESAVKKSKKQLDEIQARRTQIEMMAEWQRELSDSADLMVNTVCDKFEKCVNGVVFVNETGRAKLRKHIKRFGFQAVLEAVEISTDRYIVFKDDNPTKESCSHSFDKIGGVCYNRSVRDGMG